MKASLLMLLIAICCQTSKAQPFFGLSTPKFNVQIGGVVPYDINGDKPLLSGWGLKIDHRIPLTATDQPIITSGSIMKEVRIGQHLSLLAAGGWGVLSVENFGSYDAPPYRITIESWDAPLASAEIGWNNYCGQIFVSVTHCSITYWGIGFKAFMFPRDL